MCDDNIEIGVTEITNNILVSAQPTDQIIDINVLEEVENVELTITPSVVEVNIDVTQELITEVVTVDANTCVNIVDVTVTDATDNVTLNITPSLVEVNINRGENNLNIEEYDTFADLPTIGDTDTYYITLDENKFWRWDPVDEVYVEISDSNDKIPYLGAYKNSDLGEWGIKSNWLGLDLTPTNPPTVAGTITWNDTDGTADLILKGGNVTLQIGQEQVVRVVNKTGATLNEADFRAVRVRSVSEGGAQGQRLAVLLAMADSDADSATTIGIVTESISDNQEGFITTSGEVKKINTTGAKSYGGAETWVDGDILYLSPTHAGYLTNVKPQAPDHTVIIGWVVYAHANNGKIFVKVDNGYELDELHNVKITTPTNGQGLIYDSTLGVWKNQAITTSLTATSPLSIASNVLSITKADATTDGYLSSADWNYFSAKQQPLSGTGFVKATGSVISYDNTVYTPQSRTLTINGTAYDLSADRSWTISVGSGMRNVSSFVATSGQTSFTIVGGYTAGLVDVFVNGARLNAGDYTATNGTTVVLATGVVANDIVDIINYTASLTSGITGSGTAGYLPLWSGSSNLTNSIVSQDANGVYIDFATGTKVFKVTNGVIASQDGGLYAGSGYQLVFADYGSAEYAAIEGSSFSGASSYIRFLTNASERMRLNSSGNLGIGLTNPAYRVDVSGDVNITGTYRVNGVAIGTGSVTGTGTSGYVAKWNGTSSINNSLIFDNGTNIGINTATPSYKLHVVGDMFAYNLYTQQSTWTIGTPNGNASITGYGSAGNGTITNNIIFSTNTTEKMRITQGGFVGIGTTAPAYPLDVTGQARFSSNVIADTVLIGTTSATAFNKSIVLNSVSSTSGILFQLNGVDKGFLYSGAGDLYMGSNSNTIQLYTNGVERLRILSNGNIGIGSANAPQKLSITDAAYPILGFNIGTTAQGYIGSLNGGGIAINSQIAQPLMFYTNDINRLQITPTGRIIQYSDGFVVGSGASNTVAGGSFLAVANAAQSNWVLQQLNASFGLDWWTYSVSAGWVQRMTLTSVGQLLIGTTAVTSIEKVKIVGSASYNGVLRVENDQNSIDVNHGTINIVNTVSYGVGNDASLMFSAKDFAGTIHPRASISAKTSSALGADLVFNTRSDSAYTEKMRILSNGFVGIGNTNPATRLHVTGTISANDLLLAGSASWSYTTSGSWTSTQTIVPSNQLAGGGIYLIRLQWGGDNPYIAYGSFLWMPVQSNGGGQDNEFAIMVSSHVGNGPQMFARNLSAGGQVASGLGLRLANFATYGGNLVVTVTRLM